MKTDNTIDYFALEITDNEFTDLQKLIVRETGILINPAKRALIQNRLRPVLSARKMTSYGEYYRWLQSHSDRNELHELVCSITTNKTSFFRNPRQMSILKDHILPELITAKKKSTNSKLRIWSAGCSSGEEPYSIAIQCLEAEPPLMPYSLKILGSDIDSMILDKARKGEYPIGRVDGIDEEIVKKYFIRTNEELVTSPAIKSPIEFKEVNLANQDTWPKNNFDIIFCRNVLIYMSKDYKGKIVEGFNKKLNPGGYLFLGHSETLLGVDLPLTFEGHSIFRKER